MTALLPRALGQLAVAGSLAAVGLAAGCSTPAGLPPEQPLQPTFHTAVRVPDVGDYTAAELAAAALRSDRETAQRALRRMQNIDTVLEASQEPTTGLLTVSSDLVNATLDDPRHYRKATSELLDEDHVDEASAERLGRAVEDDPLKLANARVRDVYWAEFARLFNHVAEPVGQSIGNVAAAPYRLARSALLYGMEIYSREPITLQGRQALSHWRQFLARHPNAPEAEKIRGQVADASIRLNETQRDRSIDRARKALEGNQPRHAIVHASRALDYHPENSEASEILHRAGDRLAIEHTRRQSSLEAPSEAQDVAPPEARALALALLAPDADLERTARQVIEQDDSGPLVDEARFALAIAQIEAGDEDPATRNLVRLSEEVQRDPNMARHARMLLAPGAAPYLAFEKARRTDRWGRVRWVAFGAFANGPPRSALPRPLALVMEVPGMLQSAMGLPLRLLQWPWEPPLPSARKTAVHARQYLAHWPDGVHSGEVTRWLIDYERARGNFNAAYEVALAEGRPEDELTDLRESAAEQALKAAEHESNRSLQLAMLRRVAREFPSTHAGRQAGHSARDLALTSTATRIGITRGFLGENPEITGPGGLGISSVLLDGDPANGELHPEGVALVGGREIAVSFLAASGDEEDEPQVVTHQMNEAHFATLVSRLEESTYRNALLDEDIEVTPDAHRDQFIERARLGLSEEQDWRPGSDSHYVYRGVRERFGMVRARESILPFDLVLQGSLEDFTLGAFPRLHPPRKTPDAFLYE
ncbi:hypothetical protein MK489_01725 [Myxococcota bacterium]|nr:hypothetical protein [Myxococcota bacterium]